MEEHQNGKFCPRSLLIDTDNNAINMIRSDPSSGRLYDIDSYACGWNGTGNNFAVGKYGEDGLEVSVEDKTRRIIERTDSFSTFILVHSTSGGTGSGLVALMAEKIYEKYPK
jgi:tubulin gamma